MIRDRNMPINGWLYQQLVLVAELKHADCAETIAEAWIKEKLETIPEIEELLKLRSEHKKQADAEWRSKYAKPASDREA